MGQRIIITGASGGFGFLTAKSLKQAGHQVAGTMRSIEGRNAQVAKDLRAAGVHVIELDVRDEKSVNEGIAKAIDQLGGIDVLINNAGLGVMGMQEHFTPEDMQEVFDVNLFGVQRVLRAALPVLREQGKGTIMYTSSLLGRMTLPFYGVYNASKWALEALAENYRTELSIFGIESVIVEPGGFPTTFMENLKKPSDRTRDKAYGDFIHAPQAMFDGFETALQANTEQRPQKVADAISELLKLPHGEKPLRTVVDFMGMGEHIRNYNDVLENLTLGIYSAFGNEGMLEVAKQ